ncbi:MAG: AAA family ATPase [Campylobacterales bacterium]|nr:AAA family ATPase [Campylobacterales bacterium]
MKEKIINLLRDHHIFLTGGAGVGKSYITNEIIADFRSKNKSVVALGSTGVSAVNIGGVTIHSFFIFGISASLEELVHNDKRSKSRLKELKKIIEAADLIIIDEISMVSAALFDMIVYRLESMRFRGRLLLVGDFYQLPPVISSGGALFGELLYAFESSSWKKIAPLNIELTIMQRTSDAHFTQILSKIRQGICDDDVRSILNHLEQKSFPDNNTLYTHLYGTNALAENINAKMLAALNAVEFTFVASIDTKTKINEKRLEGWIKNLPVNEVLKIKKGSPILFCINKWGKFINGDRGVVHSIEEDCIIVEKDDVFVRVERHDFELSEISIDGNGEIKQAAIATFSQFPIKLAYAITIHKAQGMSIDSLVCNVDRIFAPSQFYVAISRATNIEGLYIDFNGADFESYMRRIIHVDQRVDAFYETLNDMIRY